MNCALCGKSVSSPVYRGNLKFHADCARKYDQGKTNSRTTNLSGKPCDCSLCSHSRDQETTPDQKAWNNFKAIFPSVAPAMDPFNTRTGPCYSADFLRDLSTALTRAAYVFFDPEESSDPILFEGNSPQAISDNEEFDPESVSDSALLFRYKNNVKWDIKQVLQLSL